MKGMMLKIEELTKQVAHGKALAAKESVKCPIHKHWRLREGVCFMCDPCKKCTAEKHRHTWHAFGSAACVSGEKDKGMLAKIKNAVIDSGCSKHTFQNKEVFKLYTPNSTYMEIANGEKISIPGKGDTFPMKMNSQKGEGIFSDALHCPELSEEALLSVSKFASQGFTSVFCEDEFILVPNKMMANMMNDLKESAILTGKKRNDELYYVDILECENTSTNPKALMSSVSKRTEKEWHLALNHPSPERMKIMTRNEFVKGFEVTNSISNLCDCSACFMGKSKQKPYPKKSERILKERGI